MVAHTKSIELTEKHQAFAEERVRAGESASVAEVVRDALKEKQRATLFRALDAADAELAADLGKETTIEELIAQIDEAVNLTP